MAGLNADYEPSSLALNPDNGDIAVGGSMDNKVILFSSLFSGVVRVTRAAVIVIPIASVGTYLQIYWVGHYSCVNVRSSRPSH